MKIWGELPKVLGIYDKHSNVGKPEKAAGAVRGKDMLSISEGGKDYQAALKALKDIPDIRTDKVEDLGRRYEAGSYDISGKEVADKIIDSIVEWKA